MTATAYQFGSLAQRDRRDSAFQQGYSLSVDDGEFSLKSTPPCVPTPLLAVSARSSLPQVLTIGASDKMSSETFPYAASITDVGSLKKAPSLGWVYALSERIADLITLPKGWDGYQGQPMSLQCARFMTDLLVRLHRENVPPPSLVPGSDGTVQMEWHRNGYDVELDVLGIHEISAYRLNKLTGKEEEMEVQYDFSKVAEWISALADPVASAD